MPLASIDDLWTWRLKYTPAKRFDMRYSYMGTLEKLYEVQTHIQVQIQMRIQMVGDCLVKFQFTKCENRSFCSFCLFVCLFIF